MTAPVLMSVLFGVVTWTLLEYVLHRFMGHDRRLRWTPFAKEHTRHHVEGDYFAPGAKKLVGAAITAVALGVPAVLWLGAAVGLSYVAGLMAFYAVYEVLHRREHTHAGIGPYGRWARRHHFTHHFVDGRTNHGVTSPLWDLVFRTYRKPELIKVPPRLCMTWLKDAATGNIRAEHAGSFVLGGVPSK